MGNKNETIGNCQNIDPYRALVLEENYNFSDLDFSFDDNNCCAYMSTDKKSEK